MIYYKFWASKAPQMGQQVGPPPPPPSGQDYNDYLL